MEFCGFSLLDMVTNLLFLSGNRGDWAVGQVRIRRKSGESVPTLESAGCDLFMIPGYHPNRDATGT